MFEKVNPGHPDKIADRIAGAIVDLAYQKERDPRIAVEVLIGHGECTIIAETSVDIPTEEVNSAVCRIAGGGLVINYHMVPQDVHLAGNQQDKIRCGDNGIFRGVPVTHEEEVLSVVAKHIYQRYKSDGKYILDEDAGKLIICQSNCDEDPEFYTYGFDDVIINPLGKWTGGTDVDTGATNRKLGSDMGGAVTGGGLHGKDLSKADVSVNIYAHLKAHEIGEPVELCCAIGDEKIGGTPYSVIVETAREYIRDIGGFEKFAEWGLV